MMEGVLIDNSTDFYKIDNSITPLKEVGVIKIIEHQDFVPTFSFSIPTFNRADLLKECIESILRQKGDDNFNVFVIDNSPVRDDETEILMMNYKDDIRINYFKNVKNLGMVNNWNRSFMFATGEWAIEVHDDDFLPDNYLLRIKHYMKEYPNYSMYVPGHYDFVNGKLEYKNSFLRNLIVKIKPCWRVVPKDFIIGSKTIPTGSTYKRQDFIESGGFNPNHGPAADYSFFAAFSKKHRLLRIDEKLVYYRSLRKVAGNRISNNKLKFTSHYVSKYCLEHELMIPIKWKLKYAAQRLVTHGGGWSQAEEYLDNTELNVYKQQSGTLFIFKMINIYLGICSLFRKA